LLEIFFHPFGAFFSVAIFCVIFYSDGDGKICSDAFLFVFQQIVNRHWGSDIDGGNMKCCVTMLNSQMRDQPSVLKKNNNNRHVFFVYRKIPKKGRTNFPED
jgi:hypothetical protein